MCALPASLQSAPTGARSLAIANHGERVAEFEQYRVRRKELVDAIHEAVEATGAKVLKPADPNVAPFELRVLTPSGEILDLLSYAFTANKYRQRGRPSDEHRFQVKYGSDFSRYHQIYVAPEDNRVTLMFGYHHEEQVFVAVDPHMHETTWFSKSVEFKDHHLAEAVDRGWFGWERERVAGGRRKEEDSLLNYQDEALLAFKPANFMRYVQFERIATGLPTGERLLLIDRLAEKPSEPTKPHDLEKELGLSARQILDLVEHAFRLKVAVRGAAAEKHLERVVRGTPGVTSCRAIDEDGKPDLEVSYRSRDPVYLECKNVGRKHVRGVPKVDFQKTRAAKGDPCSRYYMPTQFEVLAACLHPITEDWEFQFCLTTMLPPHKVCPGRLAQNVFVDGPSWERPLEEVLDEASFP